MIYEYTNLTPVDYPRLVGGLLPAPELALWLWALAAAALLWCLVRILRGLSAEKEGFVAAATALAGTYVYSSRWTDEIFINLEHTYNLWHHGRFSFSPGSWVDATVEFVYHLLLLPMAATRELLVGGNYLLGFLIALGHLVLFRRWLRKHHPVLQTAALLALSFFVPFVEVCSSGFGNSLVSLLFFYSVTHLVVDDGKPGRGLAAAALLPLLRPDALLFSAISFGLALVLRRPLRWWPAAGMASLGVYFVGVRLAYGHFVPTPMTFKSFHLSMLPLLELRPSCDDSVIGWCWHGNTDVGFLATWMKALFLSPSVLLAACVLLASLFFEPNGQDRRHWLWTRFSLVPLALVATLYIAIGLGYNPTLSRYYAPFLLMVAVVPLHYLASLGQWWIGRQATPSPALLRWLPLPLALCCAVSGPWLVEYPQSHYGKAAGGSLSMAEPGRLDDFLFGGQVVDEILPPGWRIAVTEMASFSFMNDREIVDLWGYSSPSIARSEVCSEALIRSDPSLFLDEHPEVLWARTEVEGQLYAVPQFMSYESFAAQWMFSKWVNLLGDMHAVMDRYDIVKLKHFEERYTLLLVRRDVKTQLQLRLKESGFTQTMTRPFQWHLFSQLYGELPPVQHDCS